MTFEEYAEYNISGAFESMASMVQIPVLFNVDATCNVNSHSHLDKLFW